MFNLSQFDAQAKPMRLEVDRHQLTSQIFVFASHVLPVRQYDVIPDSHRSYRCDRQRGCDVIGTANLLNIRKNRQHPHSAADSGLVERPSDAEALDAEVKNM
jgi:hypothetical protein